MTMIVSRVFGVIKVIKRTLSFIIIITTTIIIVVVINGNYSQTSGLSSGRVTKKEHVCCLCVFIYKKLFNKIIIE